MVLIASHVSKSQVRVVGEDGSFQTTAHVTDAGDGSYDARYAVPKPGRYAIHVCCHQGGKEHPIRGSPFVVDCASPWVEAPVQGEGPVASKGGQGAPLQLIGWGRTAALVDMGASDRLWLLEAGADSVSATAGHTWTWRRGAWLGTWRPLSRVGACYVVLCCVMVGD